MNRLAKIRNKVTEPLASTRKIEEPQVNDDYLTREEGENRHNKNTKEELDIKHIKPDLNAKMKEELKKHKEEQLILLKEYKQNIIDFLLANKDYIRIEDLKIYEPIYKCYQEKGYCYICNSLANIICKNCCNNYNITRKSGYVQNIGKNMQ